MKKRKKLPYWLKVLVAVVVYGSIVATAVLFGLSHFWDYIAAYERSRPQNTLDAYMAQLEVSHIQDGAAELIDSIDHNLQSRQACRQIIADAVRDGVVYAKKLSECTETRQVYMLLSKGKTIGRVTLSALPADEFGFHVWQVQEDSFDFSYLLGTGSKLTVPAHYCVFVNDTLLDASYIAEQDLHFSLIEEFYDEYDLPTMVTYQIPAILGTPQIRITDPKGNPVTEQEALDEALVLNSCTDAQIAQLDLLAEGYITDYVYYTTNRLEDLDGNLTRLLRHILPDSALAERMLDAKHGLRWVSDQQARILSVTPHHRIPLADDLYLYDVTYELETNYRGNLTVSSENIRLILQATDDGLKVLRMIGY